MTDREKIEEHIREVVTGLFVAEWSGLQCQSLIGRLVNRSIELLHEEGVDYQAVAKGNHAAVEFFASACRRVGEQATTEAAGFVGPCDDRSCMPCRVHEVASETPPERLLETVPAAYQDGVFWLLEQIAVAQELKKPTRERAANAMEVIGWLAAKNVVADVLMREANDLRRLNTELSKTLDYLAKRLEGTGS